MSYCLLIKCVDGSLNLLSETPFDTRNEALDTLASYADTGRVDCATDQVWLIDLASVAPVVLVGRPAMVGGPALQPEPEAEVVHEPEAVIEVSPEPEPEVEVVEEPQVDVDVEPDLAVEPAVVTELEPSVDMPIVAADLPEPGAVFEPDAAFAPVPAPEPMVVPVLTEDVILPVEEVVEVVPESEVEVEAAVQDAIADEFVVEDEVVVPDEAEEGDEAPIAAVVAAGTVVPAVAIGESILDDLVIPEPESEPTANEEDSFSDLREALERSAAQMASEVSAAQAAVDAHAEEAPVEDVALAEDEAAEVSDDVDDAIELIPEAGIESTDEFVVEATVEEPTLEVTEVEDIECGEIIDADTALNSEVVESAEPAEWPWAAKLPEIELDSESDVSSIVAPDVDVAVEDVVRLPEAGVLGSAAVSDADVIPGPVEPMSVTSGDDTGIEFGGISEDYANLMQSVPFSVPEVPVETAVESLEAVEPVESARSVGEEDEASKEASVEQSAVDESDPARVIDPHELIVPAGVGSPGYTPDSGGVADLTCRDCVWVDTCPNKDQRDPASCGSFQWK